MSDGNEPKAQSRRSIVLDFDGTVTVTDLLDRAALEFGDPAVYDEVETGLDGGRLPLREVITREFAPVTTPLEDVIAWALREAQTRRGFAEFVRAAQAEGWAVHVVSSGFEQLIAPILEREGVEVDLYANRVDARPDGWRVEWRYPDDCDACGESCKRSTLPPGEVVYVGDGYSDRCAALAADRVFATRGLASYLDERGRPYEYFDDFRSIGQALALDLAA
jgi:2-hydroxy-3-keto-5-methylthiopentenyl-1-phosphate phosphatase